MSVVLGAGIFGGGRAVQALVELDDLRVDGLELGLVDVVAGGGGEAVGAAARVRRVVLVVFKLGKARGAPAWLMLVREERERGIGMLGTAVGPNVPVALASALLLGVGRGLAGVAGLAEVFWEVVFRLGGAVGEADVVTVSGFVATGHWSGWLELFWRGLSGE